MIDNLKQLIGSNLNGRFIDSNLNGRLIGSNLNGSGTVTVSLPAPPIILVSLTVCLLTLSAWMNPAVAQLKQVEQLDHGLIAIEQPGGVRLSWRLPGNQPYDTGFNIYRDGEKLNETPLTGATSFVDQTAGLGTGPGYTVRAVIDGQELPPGRPALPFTHLEGNHAAYLEIPINRPETGPHGGSYHPNDTSTGDLDGDGDYDLVVKWDPSNAKDNSQDGITDNVFLDAYSLGGDHLWRIDMGPNIRAGAHYTQFMVYDFDGDGVAELMAKTAPGTRDGSGRHLSTGPAGDADHTAIYRNGEGYILDGPEYLTVFSGRTGLELQTVSYDPPRGDVGAWGDDYGNRVDRFLAGVAYLDGERPSAIFARGYYTRMVVAAWDWRNGELTRRWVFDTDDTEYNNDNWRSQGNHQLSVIDADNDGRHDIVYGSVVINSDGTGLHTTGLGHGDALHATYMVKGSSTPQIFMPHEENEPGVSLRHADSGEMLFYVPREGDIGRGVAAELDPGQPGFKFWASSGLGLYDLDGNVVGEIPESTNHVIWWDGSLSRELLNSNEINRWSITANSSENLLTARGASSINGTKANPNLQADLLGDWREEVIFRTDDNEHLRLYTTTIPTEHRLYTLMHDPVYRVAVAWQNTAYNQPPHPGFFLATGMDFPQEQPDVKVAVPSR